MARKYAVPGSREFAWWYAQKRRRDRKADEPEPAFSPIDLFAAGETGFWYDADPAHCFQDAAGTTPAGVGDPVGYVTDRSGNGYHLTQATAAARPVLQQDVDGTYYLQSDETDDLLTTTLPDITGQMAIATPEGTAIYGVDIPAGSWPFMRNTAGSVYTFMPETQGAVLVDDTLSDAEKANLLGYLAAEGGGPTGENAFSGVTDFTNYWRAANWISEFPLIDTSSGTSFFAAWYGCTSLTSFPLLDTSSGTNFSYAWYGCNSLTSFPQLDTSSGTNFREAWLGCSSLTSFPLIDTSSGTNFYAAWYACTSLTSFPLIDTSSGTNFREAWSFCSSLTSFPLIDTSSGTNFEYAWYGCSSLTSFLLIDTSSGRAFGYAWFNCSSLTDFPAGFFDSWTGTPANNCFLNAWDGCSSLTAASVENILVSIDTSGQSAPASGVDITIDYDVGTGLLTAATTTAIVSLKGKGWTITINGVLQ